MIDNEQVWEEIRNEVKMEKFTPEKFKELWQEAVGNNRTVNMEKFKNIGGELGETKINVLEKTGFIEDKENEMIIMSWKDSDIPYTMPVRKDGFFVGVQNHDSGEKSFILTHSSTDRASGKDKQTIRRFTAAKMQTAIV